jgi:flagellar basal body-associated protein FliL
MLYILLYIVIAILLLIIAYIIYMLVKTSKCRKNCTKGDYVQYFDWKEDLREGLVTRREGDQIEIDSYITLHKRDVYLIPFFKGKR